MEDEPVEGNLSSDEDQAEEKATSQLECPLDCSASTDNCLSDHTKNSNTDSLGGMNCKPEEESNGSNLVRDKETDSVNTNQAVSCEIAASPITEIYEAELCTPQCHPLDVDSSSDEEGENEVETHQEVTEEGCIKAKNKNVEIGTLQLEEQNNDSTNTLFEDLLAYRRQSSEEEEFVEPLELSTQVLSYERFFPGRILGNTFVIRNNSSKTAKFQLSFDNSGIDRLYVGEKLCEYYGCENINEIEDTYTKHLKSEINTSQEALNVWNMEDPFTKRLTKVVQMELEGDEEYEFIIVLKSPSVNKQTLFATNVFVHDLDRNTLQTILCFGCMETLNISCPKEMYNTKLKAKMIKIMMRRKQASQPIKILLENKGDMPICANFQSIEMEKNLQFYIPRDRLTIESNSKALLEIKALHKLGGKKSSSNSKPEVIHKLVVAKVKDCEFKFSLIFEITIV